MGTLASIKVEPCTVKWGSVDLGYTEGDISIELEEDMVEVTSHQTGTIVLDMIRTGGAKVSDITITLKETTVAMLKSLISGQMGDVMTPAAGTEVVGLGTSHQFAGVLADCNKLILHPVTIAAATLTDDICVWKAYPMVSSIVKSGENPNTVEVTFKVLPDTTLNTKVQYMVIGDHTQTFTA
jgi:hypothetical protein